MMDKEDILSAMLAYNIPTGDQQFENVKRDARKGLAQLRAQNNALGYMDYLEVLPFATNAGSIIQRNVSNAVNKVAYNPSLRYTVNDIINALPEETLNVTLKAGEKATKKSILSRMSTAWVGQKIDAALKASGANMGKRIAVRNLGDSIKKDIKKSFFVSLKEGIEEGQQAYMQKAYESGANDPFDEDYRYGRGLDIRSLADNQGLAFQSVLGYFGLDPTGNPLNGTDELRQQMEAGASTALWFGLGHHATGSLFNDPNSIRGWLQQYKFDKTLMRKVANDYKAQQDDIHSGMFFDALKNGGSIDKIKRSYEGFRALKDDDVISDQDIDDDIALAETVAAVYGETKKKKNSLLDDLNIERDSDEHREFVQQATSTIHDYRNVARLASDSGRKMASVVRNLADRVRTAGEEGSTATDQEKALHELIVKSYEYNKTVREEKVNTLDSEISALESITERSNAQNKDLEAKRKERDKLANMYSLDTYIDTIVGILAAKKQIAVINGLLSQIEHQSDKLKALKDAFGYKINIETLVGMKEHLNAQLR